MILDSVSHTVSRTFSAFLRIRAGTEGGRGRKVLYGMVRGGAAMWNRYGKRTSKSRIPILFLDCSDLLVSGKSLFACERGAEKTRMGSGEEYRG